LTSLQLVAQYKCEISIKIQSDTVPAGSVLLIGQRQCFLKSGFAGVLQYSFLLLFSYLMRAIVVRHYKTLLNASGQILGWGDAPKAAGWLADVSFVDDRLKKEGLTFDAVYSSSLERARRTAMYYAKSRGIHIVNDSPALNEVNYGALYKKTKEWVTSHIPQHKKDPDFVYPQGESFRDMQRRSVEYVISLAESYPERTILIVVHAGVIRGLISHFLELDYADHLKQKISHRYIGDFRFENGVCVGYDELGKWSGFVRDGVVTVPHDRSGTSSRRGHRITSLAGAGFVSASTTD
jgi:broad specificity phosphatase PhoE